MIKPLLIFVFLQVCFGDWWISWESGDVTGPKTGSNVNPSGRTFPALWVDSTDTLYLFGGTANGGQVADFWTYAAGSWSQIARTANTIPLARSAAVTWTDGANNLWLYGGENAAALYNDIWQYNGATWTAISSPAQNSVGTFNSKGSPSIANQPGARAHAASWQDLQGNIWIFGGKTSSNVNQTAVTGITNDFWSYNVSLHQWTWVGGNDVNGVAGVYGVLGQANAANYPGSRYGAAFATDPNGNFWLFGGYGTDVNNVTGYLNDLWMFSTTTGLWTWVSGSNTAGVASSFTQTNNTQAYPGGRVGASAWTNYAGDVYIIGGNANADYYNELWVWRQTGFVFIGGSNTPNTTSRYVSQHSSFYGATPGARWGAAAVVDAQRANAWLFGGSGFDSATFSLLNDLWKYSVFPAYGPVNIQSTNGGYYNWSWPVIIFVLGGFVCILLGIAFGVTIYRSNMKQRMMAMGHPEPKKGSEAVQLDDLKV